MDAYLECIDKINECLHRYTENNKFIEFTQFNRKYELMLNKKRIKELKIIKKNSSDFQQIKREIMNLKKNKHEIIDRYKWLGEIAKLCQDVILFTINELDEELVRLRFNLRCDG